MANQHIFLSYRSTEAEFALRLAADLKNAGVNLWMDRLDIKPGEDWPKALQAGVDHSVALLAVVSPEYIASGHCMREVARAVRLGLPIIPLLLRPVPSKEDWPMDLERLQYVDFTSWPDEGAYLKTVQSLIKSLKSSFTDQVRRAPDSATRYLNRLISDLEARKGLLDYAALLDSEDPVRPRSLGEDLWNQQDAFVVLDEAASEGADLLSRPVRGIQDIIERYPRFVLVGARSAGKTTMLRRMALERARARLQDASAPLPVIASLENWTPDLPLAEFIGSHWPFGTDPLQVLARGEAVLFLDGLDVLAENAPGNVKRLREWLRGTISPRRLVIACRVEAYGGALQLDLPVVQIEPMSEQRIRVFVSHYMDKDDARMLLAKVLPKQEADRQNPRHLYSLACNPTLLSALVLAYKTSPRDLPVHPGPIIGQIVGLLWERERLRQSPGWIPREEMEQTCASLALAMYDDQLVGGVSRRYALEHLGDEKLLQALASAALVEVRGDQVAFYHELLLDYFAALGLLHVGLPTRLSHPRFDDQGERVANLWDPVIILLSGITASPDAAVLAVSEVDPYLALRCVAAGADIASATYHQLITQVLTGLDGDQQAGRFETARLLIQLGDENALQVILDTLRYADWPVRCRANALLRELEFTPLPGLSDALRVYRWDPDTREALSVGLRQLGAAALPVLFEALGDENAMTRRAAVWGLGETRDRAAAPALVAALEDPDALVRREAAFALGWVRDEATVERLLDKLRDGNYRVRKAAVEALNWFGPVAVPRLLAALRDQDPEVRRLAVEALGTIHHPDVLPALYDALHDPFVEVRSAAVETLGAIHSPEVVPYLIDALNDVEVTHRGRKRVCDLAAQALRSIGTPAALEAVAEWRQDPDAASSEGVMPSSADSGERPRGSSAEHAKDRLKKDGRNAAQAAPRTPTWQKALRDPDWRIRQQAIQKLGEDGDPSVVPHLVQALRDTEPYVRVAAVRALLRTPSKAAIPGLLRALQDPEYLVCDAAAEALCRIGRPAVPGLIKALSSGHVNVRGAAANALGEIGDVIAVPALAALLGDPEKPWLSEHTVGETAAAALKKIGSAEAFAALERFQRGEPALPAAVPVDPRRREILPGILTTLANGDETAREEAARTLREYARALRHTRDAVVAERLNAALRAGDWFTRWAVADAIAWIADPANVPALLETAGEANWMARLAIIRALGEIGDRAALEGLTRALADNKAVIREAAADGLGRLATMDAVPPLLTALADPEGFVRRSAAQALGELRAQAAAPALIACLRDREPFVRGAAARALGRIGAPEAVPALIERLNDLVKSGGDDRRVCDIAAEALSAIGSPSAQEALVAWQGRLPK